MRIRFAILLALLRCLTAMAAATHDCKLGERYSDLAADRIHSRATEEAIQFLQQAIEVCPSYSAYQQLGELSADSAEESDEKRAVESFVAAYDLASSDTDRARTLFQYARLLNYRGDAQNASPLIIRARKLDRSNPEIRDLAAQIEAAIDHPTSEGIIRGLKDQFYLPLHLVAAKSGLPAGGQSYQSIDVPAVNIRINFETNSTVIDASTRSNLEELAKALRNPAIQGRHLVFVGHADERGSPEGNLLLSVERAQAIYALLRKQDPSLEGHVEVTGRGSAEPLDPGHDAQAYRANRRLQVLLK